MQEAWLQLGFTCKDTVVPSEVFCDSLQTAHPSPLLRPSTCPDQFFIYIPSGDYRDPLTLSHGSELKTCNNTSNTNARSSSRNNLFFCHSVAPGTPQSLVTVHVVSFDPLCLIFLILSRLNFLNMALHRDRGVYILCWLCLTECQMWNAYALSIVLKTVMISVFYFYSLEVIIPI